jgi:dolichol-phosphate mannosyltransferase
MFEDCSRAGAVLKSQWNFNLPGLLDSWFSLWSLVVIHKLEKISVVCPAYQEEEVLPLFHRELTVVLQEIENRYDIEILYVDDGSRDRTLTVIRQLASEDKRVRYLSFSRNFGHQAALTAGLEHARGDAVIMMDSDLQHPPGLIPELLAKWKQGFDVVLTIRQDDPELGVFKRWSSKCFYRLMSWLSDTEIRMSAADYRLMSRRALDSLLELRETHRFLRGMVSWLGFPTAEIPFSPKNRQAGVSKYTVRRMANLAFDGLISFSKVPLRLSLLLGLAAVGFSVLLGFFALGRFLVAPQAFSGTAFLLISLYLMGGCVLSSLGIVGEYVGRIYEQVKGRPHYVVKETSWDERIRFEKRHLQIGQGPHRKDTNSEHQHFAA